MTKKIHVVSSQSDAGSVAGNDLQRRARQIGALAGRAVAVVRQAREIINDQETWNALRRSAEDRVEEIRQAGASRVQEWRFQARQRVREVVRDYPVAVAVAAGAAGFIVGAALRVRRTHRAR